MNPLDGMLLLSGSTRAARGLGKAPASNAAADPHLQRQGGTRLWHWYSIIPWDKRSYFFVSHSGPDALSKKVVQTQCKNMLNWFASKRAPDSDTDPKKAKGAKRETAQ